MDSAKNNEETENPLYFNGLNGIRAIAAIAVVLSHTMQNFSSFSIQYDFFGNKLQEKSEGLLLAGFGVSMFFSLSGFLITYLLLKEKTKTATIAVKKFYIRRILRIWPLYYLYLAVAILFIILYNFPLDVTSLFFYVFYAANIPFIMGGIIPFISHYWSLGVEEQFYLFYPLLIKKIKSIKLWLYILIVCLIGSKLLFHFYLKNDFLYSIVHVTRFQCMLIGALGACYYFDRHHIIKAVNNKYIQGICWFLFFLIIINKFHFASVIDNEIVSFITLFIIIGQIEVKNRLINLEMKLFHFIGMISYGIYVIHPLIIFIVSRLFDWSTLTFWYKSYLVTFIILLATVLISHLSYTYFEAPFLKLKNKFSIIISSNKK